ncbi:hypothetical protein LZ012_05085 [Dechloromonas sp. XY25]|uniref:Uncharacterized protein n=1 Tax=Dechloromonas hankyongensis TaxID=2908002 RepID=A0ABS9JZL7_9RHOO|nr:hypothetical protein [Dechloromonas hankyongensis]MCG2576364.1 hypothetical protein [Dechloromonas hankyongensis]
MNPSTASTASQHAAPPSGQPTPVYRDERQSPAVPASVERNPAQTDDSPAAILGYN